MRTNPAVRRIAKLCTYIVSTLRLVLQVDVMAGDKHNGAHATSGLWRLLDRPGPHRQPSVLRGDKACGVQRLIAESEQRGLPYLFRLCLTQNVRRALDRAMRDTNWKVKSFRGGFARCENS
jgi:hypothetical protein